MIGWLYIREGMTGNEQIGPFTDPQIAELATARKVVHNQAVSSSNSGDGNAAGFACLITMIILGVSLVVGVVVFFLCCGGLGLAAGS